MENLSQKINFVDRYIGELTRELADGDKNLEGKLETEIKEIVLQNKLRSSNQETSSLLRLLSEKKPNDDPETLVRVKETILKLHQWEVKHPDLVRDYQKVNLNIGLKRDNPGITEEGVKVAESFVEEVTQVLDDQGLDEVINQITDEYPKELEAKVQVVKPEVKAIVRIAKMTPTQLKKAIDRTAELERLGVKIPNEGGLSAYDRIMRQLKDRSKLLEMMMLAKGRFGRLSLSANNYISKIKNEKVKNVFERLFNKPVVRTEQGFLTAIQKQNTRKFINNSIETLIRDGFVGGTENIARALNNGGKFETNNPSLVSNGLSNLATSGVNLLKKSTGDSASKLGIGTKKFLGNSFNKIGGSVVKGLNSAVSASNNLTGLLKIKKIAPLLIGFFIVIALGSFLMDTGNTSTLVTGLKIEEESGNSCINNGGGGGGGGGLTQGSDGLTLKGPVKCSVADKTVATWQCSSENSSTPFGDENCVTSVTGRRRTVCTSGCGLVSTSIILQGYDPKYTPKYILENTGFKSHGNICGDGVGWNMIVNTIKKVLGPESIDYELDTDGDKEGVFQGCNEGWIKKAICKGDVVMILFKHQPTGGHWVTAVAVMEDGDIALKDPGFGRDDGRYNYLSKYYKQKDASIRNCLAVKSSFIKNTDNIAVENNNGFCEVGGIGQAPKYGEITYTDDGRIRDCGVGMDAEFTRRLKKPHIPTSGIENIDSYNEQLKGVIGDNFGTRCGVVYAAQYLAYDFKYWVPYYWAGKYTKKGLNPEWGSETSPDKSGRIYKGLDCSGFNAWTQINGYGARNRGGSAIPFGEDCEKIKSKIEPGDTLTLGDGAEGTYHIAVVLAYDDKYIKFAHSGGGSGVSTGLIDICSGKLVNGSMTFEYLHHKNYTK